MGDYICKNVKIIFLIAFSCFVLFVTNLQFVNAEINPEASSITITEKSDEFVEDTRVVTLEADEEVTWSVATSSDVNFATSSDITINNSVVVVISKNVAHQDVVVTATSTKDNTKTQSYTITGLDLPTLPYFNMVWTRPDTISWDPVPYATGYRVQLTNGVNTYDVNLTSDITEYQFAGLDTSKTHTVTITAVPNWTTHVKSERVFVGRPIVTYFSISESSYDNITSNYRRVTIYGDIIFAGGVVEGEINWVVKSEIEGITTEKRTNGLYVFIPKQQMANDVVIEASSVFDPTMKRTITIKGKYLPQLLSPSNFKWGTSEVGKVTWDPVKNATGYSLVLKKGDAVARSLTTTSTSYTFSGINDSNYSLSIQATGLEDQYFNSDSVNIDKNPYVKSVTMATVSDVTKDYTREIQLSATVDAVNGADNEVTWQANDNIDVTNGKIVIPRNYLGSTFTVKAISKFDATKYAEYIVNGSSLPMLPSFAVEWSSPTTLTWDAVQNAKGYKAVLTKTDEVPLIVELDSTKTSYTFTDLERTSYMVQVIALGDMTNYLDRTVTISGKPDVNINVQYQSHALVNNYRRVTVTTSLTASGGAKAGRTISLTKAPEGTKLTHGDGNYSYVDIPIDKMHEAVELEAISDFDPAIKSTLTIPGLVLEKLSTPTNIKWDVNQIGKISWDAVPNASRNIRYILVLKKGDSIISTQYAYSNSYTIRYYDFVESNYTISLRASDELTRYLDSDVVIIDQYPYVESVSVSQISDKMVEDSRHIDLSATVKTLNGANNEVNWRVNRYESANVTITDGILIIPRSELGKSFTIEAVSKFNSSKIGSIRINGIGLPTLPSFSVEWLSPTTLSWDAVPIAKGYKVALSKTGAEPISLSFESSVKQHTFENFERTSYTVQVTALGDMTNYLDQTMTISGKPEVSYVTLEYQNHNVTNEYRRIYFSSGSQTSGGASRKTTFKFTQAPVGVSAISYDDDWRYNYYFDIPRDKMHETVILEVSSDFDPLKKSTLTIPGLVLEKLSAPGNIKWDINEVGKVSWDVVQNATGYLLEMKDGSEVIYAESTTENNFIFNRYRLGDYNFEITALGNWTTHADSDSKIISDRPYIESISIIKATDEVVGENRVITVSANVKSINDANTEVTWRVSGLTNATISGNTITIPRSEAGDHFEIEAISKFNSSKMGNLWISDTPIPILDYFELLWISPTTVAWDAVEGALEYKVVLSEDKKVVKEEIIEASLSEYEFEKLPEGDYSVQVTAVADMVHHLDRSKTIFGKPDVESINVQSNYSFFSGDSRIIYLQSIMEMSGNATSNTLWLIKKAPVGTILVKESHNEAYVKVPIEYKEQDIEIEAYSEFNSEKRATLTIPGWVDKDLATPTNLKWDNITRTLSWDPVKDATGYRLVFSKNDVVISETYIYYGNNYMQIELGPEGYFLEITALADNVESAPANYEINLVDPSNIQISVPSIPSIPTTPSRGGGGGGGGAPATPTTNTVDTVKNTVSNLPNATSETKLTSTDKTNITNAINQVVNLPIEEKAKLDIASIEKLENLINKMYPSSSSSVSNQTTLSAVKATGLSLALGIDEISQNNGNVSVGLEVKKATLSSDQEKLLLSQVDPTGLFGSKLLPLDLSIVKTVGGVNSNITETTVPIQITIALPAGYNPKGSYVIARDHNGVIEMLETVNNGDGTISFKSDKFSTYVLVHNNATNNQKGHDLSYYSNGKFNIYANSRVVYVSEGKDTIYMKGYAFEQFNNFSRKDSFVRELIFLDKNDPSNPNKAYRITLPSVYDPYLNKNKNLNPTGTYNYNFAYYGGWMNLNKVRKYTNPASAPLVSMPKGEYLIYIRMSDGKRSNIMSMRSTKAEVKLPSSFSLVAGTSDVLFSRK